MFSFGSGVSVPSGVLLVRHEDEVPELEEPCAARARRRAVGLAAAVLLPPVVVDLGVRPARAGAAHRPEVLERRQRDDPLDRHADALPELDRDLVGPELELRVAGVHRDPDAIPVEPHVLQDELPGELDRALLEVLPEREVAEHLEERAGGGRRGRPPRCPAVRKHFCDVVSSGAGGCSRPRKYGIIGCMPALVRSVERSSARGMSDADGTRVWPFDSKNAR